MNNRVQTKHYCLAESWSPDVDLPSDCTFVALTQQALSEFEKHGVACILLEEFYTSGEIRGDTDQFLKEQLAWFDKFDIYIQKLYPDAARLELRLASLYYYYLKYAVDNVILTVRVLNKFIATEKPRHITFMSRPAQSTELEHILSFRNMESTYSLLIESVCRASQVDFNRVVLSHLNGGPKNTGSGRSARLGKLSTGNKEFSGRVKDVLRAGRNSFSNYLKIRPPLGADKSSRTRVLLLHTTDFIYDFCKEAREHGFEFFVLEEDRVVQYHPFGVRKIVTIDRNFRQAISLNEDYKENARAEAGALYRWINEYCGLGVERILRSRIEKFIDEICPAIISLVPGFIRFYDEQRINYVLTHSIWSIVDHAAIAATRKSRATQGVGFAHGTDAFEAKSRYYKIFRMFDLLFVSSREEAEHERRLVAELGEDSPQIHIADHFRDRYRQKPDSRKQRKPDEAVDKQMIIFVPVMCVPWPQRPIELTQPFPMEYLRWHKDLADFMSSRGECYFIWKGLYLPNQRFDYMADYIDWRQYKNISFQSNNLGKWLAVADKVICDSPSTAFFEAIFSGLPALALYRPQDQRLRRNAKEAYGRSLGPYSNIAEGLERVGAFLDAPGAEYTVDINRSGTNVPKLLDSTVSNSSIVLDNARPSGPN